MQGVYKIQNKINGHCYIGISKNIKARWTNHKAHVTTKNLTDKERNYPLYQAMRKYGIENFDFSILEELPEGTPHDTLVERERYWIAHFNSFANGYNQTPGGDIMDNIRYGEQHWHHKLTEADVRNIRIRWAAKKESVRDIFKDYQDKIEKTGFKKIYSWQTWKNILPELNTEENRNWHKHNGEAFSNHGSLNGRAKLTEEDVYNIRLRKKNGERWQDVYQDYTCLTKGSFQNVWHYQNWKRVIV